jgi:triosephosphate isomerase (TIM)
MAPARQKIIAGNWKMYKTTAEAVDFVNKLAPLLSTPSVKAYLAVPYTAIQATAQEAQKHPEAAIVIGAQNMNDASEGAFTGEISARMLVDVGARFVIVGHSERRHVFHEDDAFVNRKVKRALKDHLQPIVCIGETLAERDAQQTHAVLKKQIQESLKEVSAEELASVVLAYEPVWAIGTGKTATPDIAQEAHRFCREVIAEGWGQPAADNLSILYGGSVKPDNAKTLMQQADIDGLLVGGASLSAEGFSQIMNYEKQEKHS